MVHAPVSDVLGPGSGSMCEYPGVQECKQHIPGEVRCTYSAQNGDVYDIPQVHLTALSLCLDFLGCEAASCPALVGPSQISQGVSEERAKNAAELLTRTLRQRRLALHVLCIYIYIYIYIHI